MNKIILLVISILVVTSLACGFTINLPTIKTTEAKVFEINEPAPSTSEPVIVELKLGAAELTITPDAKSLVEGKVTYNVLDWEPVVERESNRVTISQTTDGVNGLPTKNIRNEWDLALNNNTPIDLRLATGAYKGNIDLSGMTITNLRVEDGAADSTIKFDKPNQTTLERLDYTTGASTVTLLGLGNANIKDMRMTTGAGTYKLDFSGELQQDTDVVIEAGVSTITIIIPEGTKAEVRVNGGLKTVNTRGTWTNDGSTYSTDGSGNTISFDINMNLGTLDLVQE